MTSTTPARVWVIEDRMASTVARGCDRFAAKRKSGPILGRSYAPSELNSVPVHAVAGNAQINDFN
jgi:hypothetical protein